MSDRDFILSSLPQSVGGVPPALSTCVAAETESALWERFAEALTSLGGRMVEASDLEALLGEPVIVDGDAMPLVAGLPWLTTDDPWEAKAGITTAMFAVAETGSLVLSAGPGKRRLASLAPTIHVCLVEQAAVVADLAEAVVRLEARTSVFITGPSRTADIEGVLVRGVHGPKELWVLRV